MVIVLVAWVALSARRPEVTYHFTPLLAAGVWPAAIRREAAIAPATAGIVALTSSIVVSAVGVALDAGAWLEGPTLWHSRPAVTEAILFALAGSALGLWVAISPSQGFISRLINS